MRTEQENRTQTAEPAHRLALEDRTLTVTGVTEVLRVDPEAVVLRAGSRVLAVRGEELALKQLTPGDGRVEIRGLVTELSYSRAIQGGRLRRFFG